MQIGFTGTRYGMTEAQRLALEAQLSSLGKIGCAHHGCCVGADAQFHDLVIELRIIDRPTLTHGHPSNLPASYQFDGQCNELEAPRPPLKRNHDIVHAADLIFAAPAEMEEVQRSGTWSTIRYMIKMGKPLCIVFPDGSLKLHNRK